MGQSVKSEIRKMAQSIDGSIWLGTSFSGIDQVKVDVKLEEPVTYLLAT